MEITYHFIYRPQALFAELFFCPFYHCNLINIKQEAVKASNSHRDGKDGIRMAKKIFEWRQLFSNDNIFLGQYAFIRSEVGRRNIFPQMNASTCLRQNLNKILHTVVYTKDLCHTTRDLTVKYTNQPKTPPVLVMAQILVFIELKLPTEVNF